jgi:hypothetical protein
VPPNTDPGHHRKDQHMTQHMTQRMPASETAARRLISRLRHELSEEFTAGGFRQRMNATEHIVAVGMVPSANDGWPTTTPGNGNPGGGGGRTITVSDEHGQPDRVPVTSVEAAVIERIAERDQIRTMALDEIADWHQISAALESIRNRQQRFANLRSTATVEDAPQCFVAAVVHHLAWDATWEPWRATTLNGTWNEERKVCKFVYWFHRHQGRIPTAVEMRKHLERGTVRIGA